MAQATAKSPLLRILLVVLAVSSLTAPHLLAADPAFIGPVRVRDLSPISVLRLDFVPAHACSDDPDLSVIRISHTEANVFMVSDAAENYLENRQGREALTASDVTALLNGRNDFFIFDAELAVTDLEYIRALSRRTQLRVEWPILSRGGGFLDSTIESFHSATGLRSADRNFVERNDVNIAARINGESVSLTGRGTHVSSGDPTFSLQHSFPIGDSADVIVEGAAKIALGGERGYFSSGASDIGLQLSAEKRFARDAFYGGVSFVRVGDGRVFRVFQLSNSPNALVAWERRLSGRTWIIAQTTWSRQTLKPETNSPLDDDRVQITGGVRRRIGENVIATFAMTENVIHFKNTPDIGVHLSIAWFLGR